MKVLKGINLELCRAIVVVLFLFSSSNVFAARATSQNIIVFDENLNVIGQHVEYCNNYQYEGGNMNGAQYLEVTGGCGDLIRTCSFEWPDGYSGAYICTGYRVNNAVEAYFVGSGNYMIGDACAETDACATTYPMLLNGRGFQFQQLWPLAP